MYTLAEIIERLSKSMQDHEASVTEHSEFANLSITQIHYLDAIRHLENPTMTELAKHLNVTKPTATVALDRLEQDGYLTKISSAEDRRVLHVHLTKKGLRISELHDMIHQSYAELFKKALNKKELEQMTLLLNKVMDHLGL